MDDQSGTSATPDSGPEPSSGASLPPPPLPPAPPTANSISPIQRPPQAAPRKSMGLGWKIGWTLLGVGAVLLVLLVSVGGFVGHMFSSVVAGGHSGSGDGGIQLQEVVKKEGDKHERILVIPVTGVISGAPLESVGHSLVELIEEQLKHAAEDDSIKAVLLKVDSPGGEVMASDDIYRLIVEFQEKHKKPVVAAMENLAASGGYYISVPCRWIVANPLTITGSIGVIMHGYNYRGLMDKVGMRPEVFKSGRFKDMLSGEKREDEISQEERDMVQKMVNETYARFKEVVGEGRGRANRLNESESDTKNRGRALDSKWADYADGRILTGKQAHELGFVDELGGFKVAVERVKTLADLNNPELIELSPMFDLSHFFRFLGKSQLKPVSVDLGVHLPSLKPGCLYFIWRMAAP